MVPEPELLEQLRRGEHQTIIAGALRAREAEGLSLRVLQRLGAAALSASDAENAFQCLRAAERLQGSEAARLVVLWARACAECRQYSRAQRLVQSALPAARQVPQIWLDFAHYSLALGRVGAAREAIDEYRKHQPENATVHELEARCAFAAGAAGLAREHALRALEHDPDALGALRVLGDLRDTGIDPAILERFEQRLEDGSAGESERVHLGFALGSLLEARGAFSRAFRAYREANRAQAASVQAWFPDADLGRRRARLREILRNARPAPRPATGPRPIFVVGMPRSGTTLVEQILSSHPKVEAQGERTEVPDTVDALIGGKFGGDGSEFIAEFAAHYRRRSSPAAAAFVDKQPVNFAWLEMLERAFPDAVIVRLHRHPGDVCMSIYASPIRPEMTFATDIDATLDQVELFVRTCAETPDSLRPRVLEVRYEDLVVESEAGARRIVEHCGLKWAPCCLNFHASNRVVNTISAAQVRNPINSTSVGRWRRFEHQLAPWAARIQALAARQHECAGFVTGGERQMTSHRPQL